jgi:hypothetical protein
MIPAALLLILFQAAQTGSISGVLTTSAGKPAVGVRVSALMRPDAPTDALNSSAMASITQTDEKGAYRLENVPPGRYYIVAGRLDVPTYYPGTLDMSAGRDIQVSPGASIAGMNFVLKDNSQGRADSSSVSLATNWTIPVRVSMEGGGKIPMYNEGTFPVVRFTRVDNNVLETPLTATSLVVPLNPNPEYRVTIEGLAKRYTVRSIVSDKINLISDPLKLPPPSPPISIQQNSWGNGAFTVVTTGNTSIVVSFSGQLASIVPPLPPVPTIQITLRETLEVSPRQGATLTGRLANPLGRSIEAAGITGTIYDDGTFEIKNVPAGRHAIVTRSNPAGTRPVGASIVVGDQDILNVPLQLILELPKENPSMLSGAYSPGTVVPLVTVRGRLVEVSTGARFSRDRSIGRITINGNTVSYTVNDSGEFEIPGLLPGRYDLELLVSGGNSYSRTLEVRDESMTLEWAVSVPD